MELIFGTNSPITLTEALPLSGMGVELGPQHVSSSCTLWYLIKVTKSLFIRGTLNPS